MPETTSNATKIPETPETPIHSQSPTIDSIGTSDQSGHQEVEVSSEPPSTRTPYVEIAPDDEGEYHWCLWSGNGRAIACGVTGFKRRNDCQKAANTAIELFRSGKLKISVQVEEHQ